MRERHEISCGGSASVFLQCWGSDSPWRGPWTLFVFQWKDVSFYNNSVWLWMNCITLDIWGRSVSCSEWLFFVSVVVSACLKSGLSDFNLYLVCFVLLTESLNIFCSSSCKGANCRFYPYCGQFVDSEDGICWRIQTCGVRSPRPWRLLRILTWPLVSR